MLKYSLPSTTNGSKADGCSEDAFAVLTGLYRTGSEASPFPDPLDIIKNRDVWVAGEKEVAVHAMWKEFDIAVRR